MTPILLSGANDLGWWATSSMRTLLMNRGLRRAWTESRLTGRLRVPVSGTYNPASCFARYPSGQLDFQGQIALPRADAMGSVPAHAKDRQQPDVAGDGRVRPAKCNDDRLTGSLRCRLHASTSGPL